MKKCRTCEEFKPLSEYHRNKNTPDGRIGSCKECHNEKMRLVNYLKKNRQKSILLERDSFANKYPGINKSNFKSWVYRNTEYKSLRGVFGSELEALVIRFESRPVQLNIKRDRCK